MTLDLNDSALLARAETQKWHDPAAYWAELSAATAHHSAPVVALSVEALAWNAHDMLRRAGGLPIRVASKSVRVRSVLEAVLALSGYRGILAYSLDEALWLAETGVSDDIVVAYPTVDRSAIARLALDPELAHDVTIMVDSMAQLNFIDTVLPATKRETIRVCLDFDASWNNPLLGHLGVLRSPVHEPNELKRLAEQVLDRPGFELVGIMSYEAQIAGVGNAPVGKPATGALMRAVQRGSAAELAERRAAAIKAVQELTELEFVNGGGTGSIERTVAESSISEVAAGSGLYGPHLFDNYAHFSPAPAVAFALDVVRRPNAETATLLGGGWIASGVAGQDRLPRPVWPEGLSYAPREGAGEVQTPVSGPAVSELHPGDRVWLRHTKAGEIMEHTNDVVPVSNGAAQELIPSYRGEGRCFL